MLQTNLFVESLVEGAKNGNICGRVFLFDVEKNTYYIDGKHIDPLDLKTPIVFLNEIAVERIGRELEEWEIATVLNNVLECIPINKPELFDAKVGRIFSDGVNVYFNLAMAA